MARKYGWKHETTIGENTLDAIKYFGAVESNEYPFNIAPKRQVYDQKSIASNQSTPYAGEAPLDNIPIKFAPTDDRFLYYFYGAAGAVNAVGTQKPRFSLFQEDGDRKKEAFGMLVHAFTLDYEEGNGVIVGLQTAGQAWGTSSATPTIANYDTASPLMAITSVTWNGSSVGSIYKILLTGNHDWKGYSGDDGEYSAINDQFPRVTGISLWAYGQTNSAIETDKDAGTARTLVIVAKNATKTLTITITGTLCLGYDESNMLNQPIRAAMIFQAGSVTWTFV